MTSRERLRKAINHQLPDRVPRDLGTTLVTGIHASAYAKLKRALGIMDGHVRVYDPFQILAEVEETVRRALLFPTSPMCPVPIWPTPGASEIRKSGLCP